MIKNTDIKGDLHTHTIFSKHAFSTIEENIKVAKERGMKFLAITDHYWNDGSDIEKKNEINRIKYMERRINPYVKDICIIGSAEFNFGQDVYTIEKLNTVTWKPIGLHNIFVNSDAITFDKLFDLFIDATVEGFNAFAHIERELWRVQKGHFRYTEEDTKKFLADVVKLAKDKHIWLEVNEASITADEKGGIDRMKYWLNIAKDLKCEIYLGSDAHFSGEVGKFDKSVELLNEVEYPKDLILNCNFAWMKDIFDKGW